MCSAVQAQSVARLHAGHEKGEATCVAGGDEVGASVDVYCCVVRGLGMEEREEAVDLGVDLGDDIFSRVWSGGGLL